MFQSKFARQILTSRGQVIIGMRNNLVHGYNEVNYRLVWKTVQNDLLFLEERMPQILANLKLPPDFIPPELPTAE